MVTKNKLTSPCMDNLYKSNIEPSTDPEIYNITNYIDAEFLPISQHSFVPKVLEIMRTGSPELENFMKKNDLTSESIKKFPRLIKEDALVKFYRGNIGDVFKLRRKMVNDKNILSSQIVYRIVHSSILKKNIR